MEQKLQNCSRMNKMEWNGMQAVKGQISKGEYIELK